MALKKIKAPIRQDMRQRRIAYHQKVDHNQLPYLLQDHFDQLQIPKDKIISGYMAKGSEINILSLMTYLFEQGYQICLPVVLPEQMVLSFRIWDPTLSLQEDAAHVLAPGPDLPEVLPDLLLLPLIAFDDQGHRLGQGMGYYDTTLKSLTQQKPITAVGVAYEIQRLDLVPTSAKDYNMDYIITDKTLYRVHK